MELWHVMNRGVEKRTVVLDDHDRLRFIHDLFAFNDSARALHPNIPSRANGTQRRVPLVDIHAYCLMNNHYHLLLSENVENGISLFMQKLNMGYSKYFNTRYARAGALWQGKHKKVRVARYAHELYIPYYIHLNPLDYEFPQWRKGGVRSSKKALQFLAQYRWSSHRDYLGEKNFSSILNREFLAPTFGSRKRYEQEIADIITDPSAAADSSSIEEIQTSDV